MNPKQRAAEAALKLVKNGMKLGLGTGSTSELFIRALGEAVRSGKLKDVRGVPTSIFSERLAKELGIPTIPLASAAPLDLAVDGADEVDPKLNLIKGLGGALLREKIVAQSARSFVVIADASKRVDRIGTRSPLPVEVAAFEHDVHAPFLQSLGSTPVLRLTPAGDVFTTDNGNMIYDCRFEGGIKMPLDELVQRLRMRAGIVDSGLFLGIASLALIAHEDRVEEMRAAN